MKNNLLLFVFYYYIIFQTCHAQYRGLPNTPTKSAIPPTLGPTSTLAQTPKCYPETATVYFLPAPPSSPKITVLNPNPNKNTECVTKEITPNSVITKDVNRNFPPLPPPPPCPSGLPDFLDEFPSIMRDRFSRLAESEEKAKVCESCASCLKKLPIFNFGQELLDGFLAGIGLTSE